MNKICACGKEMKFHKTNSDEPLVLDSDELDLDFWYCECGKIIRDYE